MIVPSPPTVLPRYPSPHSFKTDKITALIWSRIDVFFLSSVAYFFKYSSLFMEFSYLARKYWTLDSGNLDRNIYYFALELELIIEISLREGARKTATPVVVTSISRLVSPAKN